MAAMRTLEKIMPIFDTWAEEYRKYSPRMWG